MKKKNKVGRLQGMESNRSNRDLITDAPHKNHVTHRGYIARGHEICPQLINIEVGYLQVTNRDIRLYYGIDHAQIS
ncbi:hypothetical protein KY290_021566 [Solanum tuberosum]|uniref:Uncharacterized protein n=1 Tax=Solanum tuberosum TaxID=4113 RepID=A0ABQ7V1X7_SOLTU|nr:hypothetical protein KY289_020726 [Solanum tuberosum]KAH0758073.1 hypothetical protein KY290_021566 [Solanum tuberosum]